MKGSTTAWDRICYALFPLGFVGANFITVLLLPLHSFDRARTLAVWGIFALAALLLFVRALGRFWRYPRERKLLFGSFCIPLFFVFLFLVALATGRDLSFLLGDVLAALLSLTVLCTVTALVILEDALDTLLRSFRVYAVLLFPMILCYCVRLYLPGADAGMINLGVVDYMSLAYLLLVLVVFLAAELMLNGERPLRAVRVADVTLILVFCLAISLSGTKGAILCLLFCCVLMGLYLRLVSKRGYALPIAIAAVTVCFSLFLFPFYNFENRVVGFLGEGSDLGANVELPEPDNPVGDGGDTLPGDTPPQVEDQSPQQGEDPPLGRYTDVIREVADGTAKQRYERGEISRERYNEMLALYNTWNGSFVGARLLLWKSAWQEICKAPLVGQGPWFFWYTYGTYPHNFLLELATDLGLISAVSVLALGVYIFLRLLHCVRTLRIYAVFCLYTLTLLPQMLVSGSVYSATFFYTAGMALLLHSFRRQIFLGQKAQLNKRQEEGCA